MNPWERVPLAQLAQPKQWPTLSMAEMKSSGFPVYGANGQIGYYDRFTHERPTLLIGCRGSCGSVHITEPFSYANGNAMALDALDESRADLRFLFHFFRMRGFRDVTTGTSQPQIIRQNIVRIEVPLPPLVEQRRIAETLDRAEALQAKRRATLNELDSLTQSILTGLLKKCTDVKTTPLERIVRNMHQGINTITEKIVYQTEGYPIIQSKHITQGYLDLSDARYVDETTFATYKDKYRPAQNDLLFCNIGTIGKSLLMVEEIDFLIAWNLFLIKLDVSQISPSYCKYFFDYLLDRHYFDRFLTGGTVKFINKKTLGATPIPLPPLELQREFEVRVAAVEKLKAAQRTSLAEFGALLKSLQYRAFRGEL